MDNTLRNWLFGRPRIWWITLRWIFDKRVVWENSGTGSRSSPVVDCSISCFEYSGSVLKELVSQSVTLLVIISNPIVSWCLYDKK